MKSHATRLQILFATTAIFAIAAVALFLTGAWSDAASGVFGTALGLLVPALIDASEVEKRRRTPGVKAVADDVE